MKFLLDRYNNYGAFFRDVVRRRASLIQLIKDLNEGEYHTGNFDGRGVQPDEYAVAMMNETFDGTYSDWVKSGRS